MNAPPRCVLLIEDDDSMRELLRMVLAATGLRVLEARNGDEAIAVFGGETPIDLVICDLLMHGLDGLSFVRWLRQGGHATPVLVVTGMDAEGMRERVLAAGADEFLLKPIKATDLRAAAAALLAGGSGPQAP